MPTHIWSPFTPEELKGASLAEPFGFTKGVPLLKVPVIETSPMYNNYGPGGLLENETRLYDLKTDPGQEQPLQDEALEARMADLMRELMQANEAPPEALTRVRLGMSPPERDPARLRPAGLGRGAPAAGRGSEPGGGRPPARAR